MTPSKAPSGELGPAGGCSDLRSRLAGVSLPELKVGLPALALSAAGLALGAVAVGHYLSHGYRLLVLVSWIGSNLCLFFAFGRPAATEVRPFRLDRKDRWLASALLVTFAPLYLLFPFDIPVQVSTDELTISLAAEWMSSQPALDIFSVSGYFQFPSLEFIVYGLLGRLAGGINLHNMRLIHALVGLSIVVLGFIFLRAVCSRGQAVVGAVLLGSNHALIAVSRMAMRNDSALLLELIALSLLVRGLKHGRSLYSYLGGAVAGLTFYFYEPGRMTMFIWIAAVLVAAVHRRWRQDLQVQARQLVVSLVAFVAMIAPITAATTRSASDPSMFQYQREQLLLTPEGMELQQDWVDASTRAEGVRINIVQGLATFNSRLHDHGYIYFNPGYGFVDPLSGVLIWVGLAYGLSQARRRADYALMLAPGLLIPWLTYSFVTVKAPNYTRLLITLPFVSYYSVRGISYLAERGGRYLERRGLRPAEVSHSTLLTIVLVATVVGWNFFALGDYLLDGLRHGEAVGSTGRYVAARAGDEDYSFYIASDDDYPYAPYAADIQPRRWAEWMEFFTAEGQEVEVVPPQQLDQIAPESAFSIFMNSELWLESATSLTEQYPDRRVHSVLSDGSMLAIEVLSVAEED